jgi:hypothetical protein
VIDLSASGGRHRLILTALALWVAFALFFQASAGLRASQGARITGDEPFYLMTTHSLLSDGDLDLRDEYRDESYRKFFDHPKPLWHQSKPAADGRELSPHQVGLSALVLPAYALAGLAGVKAFLGVLGGLTIALTFLLAAQVTSRYWEPLAAAAILGVSAPVFIYSTQIYPEMPAAVLVLAGLLVLLRRERPGALAALISSCAVLGLMWLGVKYAPLAAVLAGVGLVRANWPGKGLLAAALAVGGVAYVWFHLTTYGDLTPYTVNAIYSGDGTATIIDKHFAITDRGYRLIGLWTDRDFGLLRWAPALLLALAGGYFALRRWPAAGIPLLSVFAGQLAMAAFFTITMRGWWFPGRQLVTVLPLVAVLMAIALAEWRGRPALYVLTGLLAAYGLAVTIALRQATAAREVTLAVDPFEMDFGVFAKVEFLFPLYTTYEPVTWLLTGVWCGVGVVVLWLAWRSAPLDAAVALRRLRSWRPRLAWGQERSAARLQESKSSGFSSR